jgi:hypothetical protein
LKLDGKTCNPPLNGQKPITFIGPHNIHKKKKRKKRKKRRGEDMHGMMRGSIRSWRTSELQVMDQFWL